MRTWERVCTGSNVRPADRGRSVTANGPPSPRSPSVYDRTPILTTLTLDRRVSRDRLYYVICTR